MSFGRCWILVLVVAGCSGETISATTCTTEADCNLFNVAGTCEPTGFCSFPDATCIDGRRYSPGAEGDLAGACLGGVVGCGARDAACCTGTVCGPNLACGIESGTCQCGGDDQPCCGGTTCGDGFTCGASSTCEGNSVRQVAAGKGHVCALTETTVWCWGYDNKPFPSGTPGIGAAVISDPVPAPIAGLTAVAELRAGEFHTCARKLDNTLWCWGHNENGQLGDGTRVHSKIPVQVAGLTNVTRFDGGRLHTCAVGTYLGTPGLWCWGRNGRSGHQGGTPDADIGRLGNDSIVDSPVPVAVDVSVATGAGQTIKSLSTGSYHSCMVTSDNKVWCWGRNNDGSLGTGNLINSKVPVPVNLAGVTIPAAATVDEVSCSDGNRSLASSTCLRLSTGAVYCWGNGGDGQLGDGAFANRTAPSTPVNTSALGSAKLVQLVAGFRARCARDDGGAVWCWGHDKNGALGLNLTGDLKYAVPSKTRVISGATQLDMSHRTACAIDSEKRLFCWGTNKHNQSKARPAMTADEARTLQPFQIVL